ncbi:MAG: acyl-CoA dehydrogenase, partial [Alphaproteobacteria bacterium]|nr:acyl-CoA dehydrogenase [Alphaproteobacteria bacterium]
MSQASPRQDSPIQVPFGADYPEIRDAVAQLCARYPAAWWRQQEDANAYPQAFADELTQAGFLSALIPAEFGGAGLPLRAGGVILEEIHAAGCDASAFHGQMYMMALLLRHGSAAQRAHYLPRIADGSLRLQSFGVTEPASGSDTSQLKTRAERKDGHYIVNGQKVWTSRAQQSDLLVLLARTLPPATGKSRTSGLSLLLVDIPASLGKGLTIRPIENMLGYHTNEIFFDNLSVPAENLIGEEGRGFSHVLDGMNSERILLSHESLGDARFFIAKACAYAKERVVFSRPIGQNQGIQFPLARAYANYRAADAMVRAAAELFQSGAPCGEEANIARLLSA